MTGCSNECLFLSSNNFTKIGLIIAFQFTECGPWCALMIYRFKYIHERVVFIIYLNICFVSLFWFFLKHTNYVFVETPSLKFFKFFLNFNFILVEFLIFIFYEYNPYSGLYKVHSPFLLLRVPSLFLWSFYFSPLLLSGLPYCLLLTCCLFLELSHFYFIFFIPRDNCLTKLCFVFPKTSECLITLSSPQWQYFYGCILKI